MRANPSTAVVCLPLLAPGDCDALLAHLAGAPWSDGRVALPAQGSGVEQTIRSASVAEIGEHPIVARVLAWLDELNRNLYQFELTGPAAADPLLAMRYREGDHFMWHIDNAAEAVGTRKLSFTVQLSPPEEYDGGDLELAIYSPAFGAAAAFGAYAAQIRRRGAITVFPSFHVHRVSPVTRGTRVALVGWLHGARFR